MTGFSAWCVVATEAAFEARELPYAQLTAPFVLAIGLDRYDAEKAANRAILLRESATEHYAPVIARERSTRAAMEPGSTAWAASVAHEIAILNKIAASIGEIIRGEGRPVPAKA